MQSSANLSANATLRIGPLLGEGGFGDVYRAVLVREGGLEREVALKILRPEAMSGEVDAVSRLRDEGRALAVLDHPVILRAFDFVEVHGRLALITEYIAGDDLHRLIRRSDPIPPKAVVECALQIARALQAAFEGHNPFSGAPLRMIHRDLKPSNVRIGKHGQVKLLDFGMARADNIGREAKTQSHAILGSLPYLAPETSLGEGSTGQSDLYGLGCVLYEGLKGGRLFGNVRSKVVWRTLADEDRLREHVAESLELIPPGIPDSLKTVIRRVLSYEPSERGDYTQFIAELEDALPDTPGDGLMTWASAHTWKDPAENPGGLTGQTVTGLSAPGQSESTFDRVLVAAAVAMLTIVVLGVAAYLTGTAFTLGRQATPGMPAEPVGVADVVPTPAPAPSIPAAAQLPKPPPEPDPIPVAAPVPKPTPKPVPAPMPPKPEPAPDPKSQMQVYFEKEGVKFPPGPLPAGSYDIMADFGDGVKVVGSTVVEQGQDIRLVCSKTSQTCEARPR